MAVWWLWNGNEVKVKSRKKKEEERGEYSKGRKKKKDPSVEGQADRGQGKVRGHSCQPHARIGAIIIVIKIEGKGLDREGAGKEESNHVMTTHHDDSLPRHGHVVYLRKGDVESIQSNDQVGARTEA